MTDDELRRAVLPLLGDAGNGECSMHTRFSAACRALAWCVEAGRGGAADVATIDEWEARRDWAAIHQPPTEPELAGVIARVRALLGAETMPRDAC